VEAEKTDRQQLGDLATTFFRGGVRVLMRHGVFLEVPTPGPPEETYAVVRDVVRADGFFLI
jgi:hypothetical protein